MSIKRQATTQLTHENWDQDDPPEPENMGTFKTSSKEEIEKRVIRTAKRRIPNDETKKSVFSGFGGFNKTQPSSFDFLANLTNGNKTNGSQAEKTEESSSSIFGNKPITTTAGGGLFNVPTMSTATKPSFGTPTTQSTLFGGTATNSGSLFSATKTDSPGATPFKIPPATSPPEANKTTLSQISSTIFGMPMTSTPNVIASKSPFASTSPFKTQSVQFNTGGTNKQPSPNTENKSDENNCEEKKDDKKIKYYSQLKGLNESVSDWIKKHVEKTPLCILSPIFKDYEKYLKEIQDEYHGRKEESNNPSEKPTVFKTAQSELKSPPGITATGIIANTGSSLFSSTTSPSSKAAVALSPENKPTGFSFGINPTSNSSATTPSGGFSFGINPQTTTATTSPFSLANTTTNTNEAAPFSFSVGKPFSFSQNTIQKNTEEVKANDEEDEPPKVEYTPVVEDNSIFDIKCKIFVKKDGNFVDNGVGTLYIKEVDKSKHQLLVRANTSLGNVIVNLMLNSSIPTQRLGKNNVLIVCIPTPDSKPPPTPILIRVKTSEEADKLLETLDKYKE